MTTVAKLHLPPVDCRHQAGERPPPLHFLSRRLFLDPVCVKGRGGFGLDRVGLSGLRRVL
ncbi:UNVERIFIED_CONTAM: hypothetical protein Sangu_1427800 [Sesamum angustifolium]|uniref:Uncharacterized protein n=1 Tax=Sesamum angustifolium TaxID=2727405 RepID=A0AAW2N867_9LAMI